MSAGRCRISCCWRRIFIAINAPRDAAVLACFGLGVMQDICSQQPLGLSALSLSLVAMFVVGFSPPIYGQHPFLHFALTFGCALMAAAVAILQGFVRGPHVSITLLFNSALYSALVAPLVLAVLQKMRAGFAFQSSRRKGRL